MSQGGVKILYRGPEVHEGVDGRLLVDCPQCRVLCRRGTGWTYRCRKCGQLWMLDDPPASGKAGRPDPGMIDHLAKVTQRERESGRWNRRPLECDSTWHHVFECELCSCIRPVEEAREPGSRICIHCVRAAGLEA
jgi:hypothetical protein